MSDKLVNEIVDELAPRSERGKPALGLGATAAIVTIGGATRRGHGYENSNMEVLDGTGRERAIVISWQHRKCKEEPETFPLQQYPYQSPCSV